MSEWPVGSEEWGAERRREISRPRTPEEVHSDFDWMSLERQRARAHAAMARAHADEADRLARRAQLAGLVAIALALVAIVLEVIAHA